MNWLAFLGAMAVVELTPGPNMGWLTALAAQRGRRVGFTAVAGINDVIALAFPRRRVHDEVLAAGLVSDSSGTEPRRHVVVHPAEDDQTEATSDATPEA